MIWTVVRFPNGSWSYGGQATDPDYAECEVWRLAALTGKAAVKLAQAQRRRDQRKIKARAAATDKEQG